MNVQELRIANWLLFSNKIQPDKYVQVDPWFFRAFNIETDDINAEVSNYYSGIPLTPEILEKSGFELQPQRISIWIKGRVKIWLGHNGAVAYLRHEDKDESYYIPNPVQNLHQLQNLVFVLTGTELEIKL